MSEQSGPARPTRHKKKKTEEKEQKKEKNKKKEKYALILVPERETFISCFVLEVGEGLHPE